MRGLVLSAIAATGVAALALPPAAGAVDRSGTVVAVIPASQANGAAGNRTLYVSGPIYTGDIIKTSGDGEAQIRLDDDTKLVVGPNSYMVVDEFVFDSRNKAKKVSLNAVRGAFRFITGSSRKDAYEIKTPTATIGVRGTEFDFTVDSRGEMNLALFEGEARICRQGQTCVAVSGACNVVSTNRRQPVRQLETRERLRALETKFPYVASQVSLRKEFQVDTSDCETRRAGLPPPTTTGSLSRPPPETTATGGGGIGPIVTPPTPPTPQDPPTETARNNNGIGNGGEGNEGPTETGNPGNAGGGSGGSPGNSGNAPGHNK